jgi:DNA-binding response OmpR family regulator
MSKVMLVEDDETMLGLLSTLLELEGFQVVHGNGQSMLEESLDELRREQPDLALVDVHLQNFNGLDLLRRLRQDEQLKRLLVLMSSGMEMSAECIYAGADGFILKPYMPDELVGKIRFTLAG